MVFLLLPLAGRAEDFDALWINTVRTGAAIQVNAVPPVSFYCGGALNCGYGEGFTQGRLDWLSELSLGRDGIGLKASLEARKDVVEAASSYLQLYEAVLHGSFGPETHPLTLAIGRQTVIWGETQFFPDNAIAGAQAPIDMPWVFDGEGYQTTSHYLPVGQASFAWEFAEGWTLLGYQQFEWRRDRYDPEDAYAPVGAVLGARDNHWIALRGASGTLFRYHRTEDDQPAGTDQFGAALRWRREDWRFGLYALQFDGKTPDITYYYGNGGYALSYAKGVCLAGASAEASLGEQELAGEISARRHTPLLNNGLFARYDTAGTSLAPRGDTLHGQMALTTPVEPSSLLPGGASWVTEIAANRLMSVTANRVDLAPKRSRDAAGLRSQLAAHFYQVAPRLDLTVPIGLGYNFAGRSAVLPEMNRNTGDVTFGLAANFDRVWSASLAYTHYFGLYWSPTPTYHGRALSDWDRVSFGVQRSF